MSINVNIAHIECCARERIAQFVRTANITVQTPLATANIFTFSEIESANKNQLQEIMESLTNEYSGITGFNISYDCSGPDGGCQLIVYSSPTNSPGGRCAFDFNIRRFKRGSPTAIVGMV
jgi:hypothetical protein